MSVTTQAVVYIVKERSTKARDPRNERSHLKIFWDRGYNITGVTLNSKNT